MTRRGSVYVLVLAIAVLVSVIGVSGVMAGRVLGRSTDAVADGAQARLLARSALEWSLQQLAADGALARTALSNNEWINGVALDRGAIGLAGTDPLDGDLLDDANDSIAIVAVGWSGAARHLLEATIDFTGGVPELKVGSVSRITGATQPLIPVSHVP